MKDDKWFIQVKQPYRHKGWYVTIMQSVYPAMISGTEHWYVWSAKTEEEVVDYLIRDNSHHYYSIDTIRDTITIRGREEDASKLIEAFEQKIKRKFKFKLIPSFD